MPGFTTHYIMGVRAYNNLPNNKIKHIISKYQGLYQLGLQGPDIFFYNIPILRHRDYRNVGSYMHESHVSDFFMCYLKHLSMLKSDLQRQQGLAYFCGFLCHYIGDSICHPYIYGRINYDVENPTSYHHGRHAALENDIDAILLKKYKGKKPSEFNQAATICLNPQETQFISQLLSTCINETFYKITYRNSFQISNRSVHFSIMAIKFGCRTLQDKSGKKKSRIEFVEHIFLNHPIVSKKLVTDQIDDIKESLNSKHQIWCNPWNGKLASKASFPELFYQSLEKCSNVYYIINNDISRPEPMSNQDFNKLLNELGNFSYHSGLTVN